MKVLLAVLAILIVLVMGMFGMAQMETARAAAEAARAAQIAAGGQAMGTFWMGTIMASLVCGGGALFLGGVALMIWSRRPKGRQPVQQPPTPKALRQPRMDPNTLMTMMMFQMLNQGRTQTPRLPAQQPDDQVVYETIDDNHDFGGW